MDTLPLELKQRVCAYLSPNHLKPFRLTSKENAAAAAIYLIPRLFLFNHPHSFAEVDATVTHPIFSKHVNTIVVDPRCLCKFPNMATWMLFLPPHWNVPKLSDYVTITESTEIAQRNAHTSYREAWEKESRYTEEELEEVWQNREYLANAQRNGDMDDLVLDSIAHAFAVCPNLVNLVITCNHMSNAGAKRDQIFNEAFQRSYVYNQAVRPSWNLSDMLRGISRHDGVPLETMTLQDVEFSDWSIPWDLLRHLKHLRVRIRPCSLSPAVGFDLDISAAQNLETLWIDYPIRKDMATPLSLEGLMQTTHLKSLRECLIAGVSFSENSLVDFLLRHSSSLRCFSFGECEILTGTWPSVFSRLSKRLPVLERVQFFIVWESNTGQNYYHPWYILAAQETILHGSPLPEPRFHDEEDDYDESTTQGSLIIGLEPGLWDDYSVNTFW